MVNERVETALHPKQLIRLKKLKGRVFEKFGAITVECAVTKEPVPFPDRKLLEYKLLKKGAKWGNLYECGWLRLTASLAEDFDLENTVLILDTLSEGALVDPTGSPVQGLTGILGFLDVFGIIPGKRVLQIPKNAIKGQELELWVELGHNGLWGKQILSGRLIEASLAKVNEKNRLFYYDYLTAYFIFLGEKDENERVRLKNLLDEAYSLSKKQVDEASKLLQPLFNGTPTDMIASAIGHSHLDIAWLWPMRETVRKAGRTFANAITNIEKYPFYVFGASQALQFQWMKETYPALYAKIREYVREGRIECLGSMWVEPDINMSGGESIIRQIGYGKAFFEREFGVETNTCWLPDVFGFSGALPQILKKCGVDNFLTIKLSWNKFNKFPYTSFKWAGIDGTEVLAHMPPEGSYCSDMAPFSMRKAERLSRDDKDKVKTFMLPFGPGDGGGGAGEVHLEVLKREATLNGYPRVKTESSKEFFSRLAEAERNLPVYKGELYLEAHQGTFTSQIENKLKNRICEKGLHKIEFLEALTTEDKELHDELWKDVLVQQFHDILPGTSIERVHKESIRDYLVTIEKLKEYQHVLLKKLKHSDSGFSVINYSPYPQERSFLCDGKWYRASLAPYSAKPLVDEANDSFSDLKAVRDSISNGIITIKFDEFGFISSLTDENEKEYSNGGLNRLTVYKDKRLWWNASDMDYKYFKRVSAHPLLVERKAYVVQNKAIMECRYIYFKMKITQKTVLELDVPYVVFETEVDFNAKKRMLRADFNLAEGGENAVCDIQFGNIARSTDYRKIEQFEICAHKWVDVSNEAYGSAILSEGQYGFRAKGKKLSLCLVRGTVFPGKNGGKGKHSFRYAFYPHKGNTFDSRVPEMGYRFNYPLELVKGRYCFDADFSVSHSNIVLETVKKCDNGRVFRLYEDRGESTEAIISYEGKAYETDLLENNRRELTGNVLSFKPYEIKTIIVERGNTTDGNVFNYQAGSIFNNRK